MKTTSIVLAGGRGSRLGREKHTEVIAGRSLIERAIANLYLLSTEILIIISTRQLKTAFRTYSGVKTVVDLYPGMGPLGGIYTGLVRSSNSLNLAVACDMPFLNRNLLGYMLDIASGWDVVIPRIGNYTEPLHAVYTKNCAPAMKRLLDKGELKITDLFDSVRVRYVEEPEINRFDPEHLSFFNINTKADLEKAKALALREL